jgi:RCC1 and BTB domain-containing protein
MKDGETYRAVLGTLSLCLTQARSTHGVVVMMDSWDMVTRKRYISPELLKLSMAYPSLILHVGRFIRLLLQKMVIFLHGMSVIRSILGCIKSLTSMIFKVAPFYSLKFYRGLGKYGVLGHDELDRSVPSKVDALADEDVIQVACGTYHTVALTTKGTVYSWGKNAYGRTGHGKTKGFQDTPKLVKGLVSRKVIFVSACSYHAACVTDDGFALTWGEGEFGRLGHGDEKNYFTPKPVEALFDVKVKEMHCGVYHTAACTMDGKMYTFGRGDRGQLGHGDKENRLSPTLVKALLGPFVTQVRCGLGHTIALTSTGSVYTWGCGANGNLGHGNRKDETTPCLVETLRPHKAIQIATFNSHSAALIHPASSSGNPSCTIS